MFADPHALLDHRELFGLCCLGGSSFNILAANANNWQLGHSTHRGEGHHNNPLCNIWVAFFTTWSSQIFLCIVCCCDIVCSLWVLPIKCLFHLMLNFCWPEDHLLFGHFFHYSHFLSPHLWSLLPTKFLAGGWRANIPTRPQVSDQGAFEHGANCSGWDSLRCPGSTPPPPSDCLSLSEKWKSFYFSSHLHLPHKHSLVRFRMDKSKGKTRPFSLYILTKMQLDILLGNLELPSIAEYPPFVDQSSHTCNQWRYNDDLRQDDMENAMMRMMNMMMQSRIIWSIVMMIMRKMIVPTTQIDVPVHISRLEEVSEHVSELAEPRSMARLASPALRHDPVDFPRSKLWLRHPVV